MGFNSGFKGLSTAVISFVVCNDRERLGKEYRACLCRWYKKHLKGQPGQCTKFEERAFRMGGNSGDSVLCRQGRCFN